MAKIVKLNVMLSASSKGLSAGVNAASKSLDKLSLHARVTQATLSRIGAVAPKLGAGLLKLGTAGAAGLAGLTAGAVAAGGALAAMGIQAIDAVGDSIDAAKKLGLGYNQLKALEFAAVKSGVGIEGLNTALEKMSDTIASAQNGDAGGMKALASIGVSVEKLDRLRPEQRFEAIANAINRIQDPGQKIEAALNIFGKSGAALVNVFTGVDGAIAQAAEKLKLFGGYMSDFSLATIAAAGDALDDFKKIGEGFKTQIADAISPYIVQAEKDTEAWLKTMGGVSGIVDGGLSMLSKALDWIASKTDHIAVAWEKLTGLWGMLPDWAKTTPAGAVVAGITGGLDNDVAKRRADRAAGGGILGGARNWATGAQQAAIDDFEAAQQAEVQAGHDRRRQQRMEQMGGVGAWLLNTPSPVSQAGMQAPAAQTRTRDREDPAIQILRNIEANTGKNKIAFAGPN